MLLLEVVVCCDQAASYRHVQVGSTSLQDCVSRAASPELQKERVPMEVTQFEDLQEEFMARVSQAVYCAMATIDGQNRPRLRVMHPIWDGCIGWIISWPASHKAGHLARN